MVQDIAELEWKWSFQVSTRQRYFHGIIYFDTDCGGATEYVLECVEHGDNWPQRQYLWLAPY